MTQASTTCTTIWSSYSISLSNSSSLLKELEFKLGNPISIYRIWNKTKISVKRNQEKKNQKNLMERVLKNKKLVE
jgi:hypothetical protein